MPDVNHADDRLTSERAFHNARYAGDEGDARGHLDKWYAAVRKVNRLQEARIHALAPGSDVLEYGCADGTLSIRELGTARFSGRFTGIDISDAAVARANRRAEAAGLARATYRVMNAEAMDFADASFDLVYGRGILHHLDLERAFSEIRRVLRPGGVALFTEPLGHNPALNWYRRRTPALRTPDEHPLLMADLDHARRHYAVVEADYAGLTTLAAVPFRATRFGDRLLGVLERVDGALFTFPSLRRNAWYVLLSLRA